jgi:hypothetical protein
VFFVGMVIVGMVNHSSAPWRSLLMSILQPIIEQLKREREAFAADAQGEGSTPAAAHNTHRTSTLGCHAAWYVENLEHCSEPMLQYELAWIQGRIQALEHCCRHDQSEADSRLELANHRHVTDMLAETQLFQTLLLREFAARGLHPKPPKADVIPSEEAWEITSQKVKESWGIL